MSWNPSTLMDYVRCLTILWSTRKRCEDETTDHGRNIICRVCHTYRDLSRRGRNTTENHKTADCEYWLHDGGERQDLLRWSQGVVPKGHGRQNVGRFQDIFRKIFQRDQSPITDISVISIRNKQHKRRTLRRRGEGRNATAIGGSAREFGHIDGSRQTGSDRVFH